MDREAVIAHLKSVEPKLRASGVAALYLVGSYARDDAKVEGDLDLMVETAEGGQIGSFGILSATDIVESALPNVEVNLLTRDNIAPLYWPFFAAHTARVF